MSAEPERYLVVCGGDGYSTVIAPSLDQAIAELGRMHIGSDDDMDDEMVEAIMKHARDPDNWGGGGTSYKLDHEDGWAEIIKMSPEMGSFFDVKAEESEDLIELCKQLAESLRFSLKCLPQPESDPIFTGQRWFHKEDRAGILKVLASYDQSTKGVAK